MAFGDLRRNFLHRAMLMCSMNRSTSRNWSRPVCAGSPWSPDRGRLRRAFVLVALVGAVIGLASPSTGAADSALLAMGPSTAIQLPANALSTIPSGPRGPAVYGRLSSVACSPSDSCVAVGNYQDNSSGAQPMAVSESDGTWAPAVEIALPLDARQYGSYGLDSVACPAAGSCVAIGEYDDTSGNLSSMAVSESGGVWGEPIAIPGVALRSVACSAPGSCVAIGAANSTQMMGVIESDGVWEKPQMLSLPENAAPNYVVELAPVVCQMSGLCVVVGSYTDTSHHDRIMGVTESGGKWGPATEIALPANVEGGRLSSVACPSPEPGSCVAVGAGYNSSGSVSIGVGQSGGQWNQAKLITPLSASAEPINSGLSAVACAGSGLCIGVGNDRPGLLDESAIAISGSGGALGPASVVVPPSNARLPFSAQLQHVACSSSSSCVAIGTYAARVSGGQEAMAVSESNGVWGKAGEITAPPTESPDQASYQATLNLLACPGVGPCVALGQYYDKPGNLHLMAAGTTPTLYGNVSLFGSTLTVRKRRQALVALSCVGTANCVGTVTLTAATHSRRKKHSAKAKILGISHFRLSPETTATIRVQLNAAGRTLLRAGYGHLSANLTISKTSPLPMQTKPQDVHLTPQLATQPGQTKSRPRP
jgi:hypothetical protein